MTPGGRATRRRPKTARRRSNQRAARLKVPPGVYTGSSLRPRSPRGIRARPKHWALPAPLDAPAAVDDVNLPGGIARRSEVHDQIRDFLWLSEAPDRLARDEGRPGLLVVTLSLQAAFERRGLHRARTDGIAADPP